jgi:hypothetical protein
VRARYVNFGVDEKNTETQRHRGTKKTRTKGLSAFSLFLCVFVSLCFSHSIRFCNMPPRRVSFGHDIIILKFRTAGGTLTRRTLIASAVCAFAVVGFGVTSSGTLSGARFNGRDMRLTDVYGELIPQIVSNPL